MTTQTRVRCPAVSGVLAVLALTAILAPAVPFAQSEKLKDPAQLTEQAPATYRARVDTSRGAFVIQVTRAWAPLAADRFYNLVKNGFYDGTRFFRVRPGFMAQFGLHGDPEVSSAWRSANLRDEKPTQSNTRGKVSFTQESAPNTRFTMVFINYADNSYLDANGFAPFGEVVSGMAILDKLNGEYENKPDQRRILRDGNAYLSAEFPRLDSIKKATIER
jgi:peptidyl-prolyl cis-trans isomerase A (cyclophilin A)